MPNDRVCIRRPGRIGPPHSFIQFRADRGLAALHRDLERVRARAERAEKQAILLQDFIGRWDEVGKGRS